MTTISISQIPTSILRCCDPINLLYLESGLVYGGFFSVLLVTVVLLGLLSSSFCSFNLCFGLLFLGCVMFCHSLVAHFICVFVLFVALCLGVFSACFGVFRRVSACFGVFWRVAACFGVFRLLVLYFVESVGTERYADADYFASPTETLRMNKT